MESHLRSQQCLLVIDTDALMAQIPNPSLSQLAPTPLPDGVAYLIQEGRALWNGSVTAIDEKLVLSGNRGNMVFFRTITVTGNSSDATLLYAVIPAEIDRPGFAHLEISRLEFAVQPDPNQIDGLPPLLTSQSFSSMKAFFLRRGLTSVYLGIAIFQLADDGEAQIPWGYFSLRVPVSII